MIDPRGYPGAVHGSPPRAHAVTNAIDRLVASGLVARTPDDQDRRRVYASLTSEGKRVLRRATKALTDIDFGLKALDGRDREQLFEVLRSVRAPDFSG